MMMNGVKAFVIIFSFFAKNGIGAGIGIVAETAVNLRVDPPTLYASVGSKPELKCFVSGNDYAVLTNTIKWEHISPSGKRTEISIRSSVENYYLRDKYHVQHQHQDGTNIFLLQFLKGIDKQHGGVYQCVLYDQRGNKRDFQEVRVTVCEPENKNSTSGETSEMDKDDPSSCNAAMCFSTLNVNLYLRAAVLMKIWDLYL